MNWVSSRIGSSIPPNAVVAGRDHNGILLYIARGYHRGDLIPGKVVSAGQAFVSFDKKEHSIDNYEVLCGNKFTWISANYGEVPDNALCGGRTSYGENLYIGRTQHINSVIPGKIQPSYKRLCIPDIGYEIDYAYYEVLVEETNPQDSLEVKSVWVQSRIGAELPGNAVVGGEDSDGSLLYIARGYHGGDLIPGKVAPEKHRAYVSFDEEEHVLHDYEVLCGGNNFTWKLAGYGYVPKNAVPGGRTSNGETLYIGRIHHLNSLTMGKIHPSNKCLSIPYNGQEITYSYYEVLVEETEPLGSLEVKSDSPWVQSRIGAQLPANAVVGGEDSDGSLLYIARAYRGRDLIPGKLAPEKHRAYVSFDKKEHSVHIYEVFCSDSNFTWKLAGYGQVPNHAVSGGRTSNGETLYIGRIHHLNSLTMGKIHPSNKCLYIPYEGEEVAYSYYEVLVEETEPLGSLEVKSAWVQSQIGVELPENAIVGGEESDGSPLYIARGYHGGDLIPGKVAPEKQRAYVSFDEDEHLLHDYEVLCGGNNFTWKLASYGYVPINAVPGGRTSNGETLYIGRIHHLNSLTMGKIHPSNKCLYIPYDGKEIGYSYYEVLVEN